MDLDVRIRLDWVGGLGALFLGWGVELSAAKQRGG